MVYANPNGHDWAISYNWDGLGISFVAFGVAYSLLFYAMCAIMWYYRKDPIIKMRKPALAIASLLVLHVYIFMLLIAYALNGHIPCYVEFWFMSFYFPMGIGLFQAQNQRLLVVSQVQKKLMVGDDIFVTLGPRGGPKKWKHKLVRWWRESIKQNSYEGYVAVGMIIQFVVSTAIFLVSRKFTGFGVVSQHVSKGMCRRGWEWAPSVVWQLIWTWILGPILIWKVRKIQDIYYWRLQTTLCVVAGLPGSPLWLLSAYDDGFAPVNKYWIPAAWFVPGLMTMEMVTLGFPIWQLVRNRRASDKINQQLAEHLIAHELGLTGDSIPNSSSKKEKRSPMHDLEKCLSKKNNSFLSYIGDKTFTAENVFFLLKVQCFMRQWDSVLRRTGTETERVRMALYRAAVNIFICLVWLDTAPCAINISSIDYKVLEGLFGEAATLVAEGHPGKLKGPYSRVCPWDEAATVISNKSNERIEMVELEARRALGDENTDFTINLDDPVAPDEKLDGFKIPEQFSKMCFDAAYSHIMQVVWTGPWHQYQDYVGRLKEIRCKGCGGVCHVLCKTCERSQ